MELAYLHTCHCESIGPRLPTKRHVVWLKLIVLRSSRGAFTWNNFSLVPLKWLLTLPVPTPNDTPAMRYPATTAAEAARHEATGMALNWTLDAFITYAHQRTALWAARTDKGIWIADGSPTNVKLRRSKAIGKLMLILLRKQRCGFKAFRSMSRVTDGEPRTDWFY